MATTPMQGRYMPSPAQKENEMTPNETIAILRKFACACRTDECIWGTSLPGVPTEVGAAVESAIEMLERTQELETALREFAWSNNSESPADCTRSVLED